MCMTELLALGGEADLVTRGQFFGSCIRHASSGAQPGSIVSIVISMIEPPLQALLMAPTRGTPLLCSHGHCTRPRAVPPASATRSANREVAATPRAFPLDADTDHRRPTPKSWM